jgi:N-acetylmuramoyl-L-alanine amidase
VIVQRPSPNHDGRPAGGAIDMLVLHYTGMRTAEEALARLCDPAAKVSAHYVIDEDGTVSALVAEGRRAWHAGVADWARQRDINACSIGIELVNPGHEFGYRAFPGAQLAALETLCLFDWARLARAGIGLWPEPGRGEGDLARFGYDTSEGAHAAHAATAFQRHWRPGRIDGVMDDECRALLAGLLDLLP